jgi:hypothetical protein
MPSINQENYPDFVNQTNSALRLLQPEPQYSFAQAAFAAGLSLAAINAGAQTVQQYVSINSGGAPLPPGLDRMIRFADGGFAKMIQKVEGFGKNQGDTITFKRPIFDGGGYTEAARRVTPDKATATTGRTIRREEVPIVLDQFEGPYASDGSAVEPYNVTMFDAKYRKNMVNLADEVSMHLKRDFIKWLDTVLRDRFSGTRYTTLPNGIAGASSFVAGGTQYFSMEQFLRAKKALVDREWAPFANGDYLVLVPSLFNTQMIQDPDYVALSANQAPANQIFGQIARIQNLVFAECSTLKSYTAGTSVYCGGTSSAVATATTVAAGVTLHEALVIGPEAVGFGEAEAPSVFFGDSTDFGKLAQMIWRAVLAFSMLDERGVERVIVQA